MNVPVVLITYNRPHHTQKVLEALREHSIKNLIIYSDGPKSEIDIAKVYETRLLLHRIDWTEPIIVERDENYGLAKSITTAANNIFKTQDRLILLEDDCVPQKYFFQFMESCLKQYEKNDRVFGISGYSIPLPKSLINSYLYDVYFSPRIGSWGWGTWKSAWEKHVTNFEKVSSDALNTGIDLTQGGNDIPIMIQQFLKGQLKDVWTLNWILTVYMNKGYYVYPTTSHIKNVGMDGSGVHCGITAKFDTLCAAKKATRFPKEIILDQEILRNFNAYYDIASDNFLKDNAGKYPTTMTHADTFTTHGSEIKVPDSCRILQVADHQIYGGAAIAGHRLFDGLNSSKKNVKLITFNDPPVHENGCYSWTQFLSTNRLSSTTKKLPPDLYKNNDWLEKISAALDAANPQIINLHNIHEAIHYHRVPFEALDLMSKTARLVFTLHDMWWLTGRCAYAGNCQRFIDHSCDNRCPSPKVYPQANPSKISELLHAKIDFFNRNPDAVIVTPSQWLARQAQKSYLKNHRLEVIPYGIDTTVFRPDYDRDGLKHSIGFPRDALVLLISAANLTDPRKGAQLFLKALSTINEDLIVLTVGKTKIKPQLPENVKLYNYGFVTSQEEMAFAYSVADLFICPSFEDNLPCVLVESISCGTPCIGFNIGGVPEIIRPGVTGWIAPEVSSRSLVDLISNLVKHPDKISELRPSCREVAIKEYALNIQADRYLELYHQLIGQKENHSRHVWDRQSEREQKFQYEYNEIQKLFGDGNISAGKDRLEKLVESCPEYALGHNDLGVVSYTMGLKEKAFNHYENAVRLEPTNIVFLKNLADYLYVEQRKIKEAMKIYVQILQVAPQDVETLMVVGHLCVALNKIDEAKSFFGKVLETEPDHKEARSFCEKLDPKIRTVQNNSNDAMENRVNDTATNFDFGTNEYMVSAIVSVYKAEKYIRGCLENLENQTITEKIEIIVVNSGSDENEEEIVKEFQKKNKNIKYIKTECRETRLCRMESRHKSRHRKIHHKRQCRRSTSQGCFRGDGQNVGSAA